MELPRCRCRLGPQPIVAMRLKLKLKKIPRRRQQKKWKLDSLVTKVELFRNDIEEEVQCVRQGTTEEGWENLKGVVMKSAEGNVGYLKAKVVRKPWITTAIMERRCKREGRGRTRIQREAKEHIGA